MTSPQLICLTPVLNEAWILDRFLQSASLWADYIIIADQGSTDGSAEIAKRYEKVIFIDNPRGDDFNEMQMRAPLFEAARKIEGRKILLGMDADEIFTPNFDSPEWNTIRHAPEGTIISFPIHNLLPDGTYWAMGDIYSGFVDDGTPYHTGTVHSPRMILPPGSDVLLCHEICILHYKYMDCERMQQRNRWYQCFERVKKENDPVGIFRRYHHLDGIPKQEMRPWPQWWKEKYADNGIEITSVIHHNEQRWNRKIVEYMLQYGTRRFAHLNIWNVNWSEIAQSFGYSPEQCHGLKDPRRYWEKAINRWLITSQGRPATTGFRLKENLIRKIYR